MERGFWGKQCLSVGTGKQRKKLALINEIREHGHVLETCRKYGSDPTMFYRCKESYEIFGMEGLRSWSRSIESGLCKLKKEDDRLKKIIAEKELEVAKPQDVYKKMRRRDRRSLITDTGVECIKWHILLFSAILASQERQKVFPVH